MLESFLYEVLNSFCPRNYLSIYSLRFALIQPVKYDVFVFMLGEVGGSIALLWALQGVMPSVIVVVLSLYTPNIAFDKGTDSSAFTITFFEASEQVQ